MQGSLVASAPVCAASGPFSGAVAHCFVCAGGVLNQTARRTGTRQQRQESLFRARKLHGQPLRQEDSARNCLKGRGDRQAYPAFSRTVAQNCSGTVRGIQAAAVRLGWQSAMPFHGVLGAGCCAQVRSVRAAVQHTPDQRPVRLFWLFAAERHPAAACETSDNKACCVYFSFFHWQ